MHRRLYEVSAVTYSGYDNLEPYQVELEEEEAVELKNWLEFEGGYFQAHVIMQEYTKEEECHV